MSTATAVRQAITVNAVPPERAFTMFTGGFNGWWPRSHHIGKAEMAEAVIEEREGGRWYERGVDGSECDWGNVSSGIRRRASCSRWQLSSEWAYDADVYTELEITFVGGGSGRDAGRARAPRTRGLRRPDGGRCGTASTRTGGWRGPARAVRRRGGYRLRVARRCRLSAARRGGVDRRPLSG